MSKKKIHKFPYKWNMSDGYPSGGIDYHGSKVFSCFACGGGSSMGYKLAGYDVLGMNEIDHKMAACYVTNHKPKYAFVEPIQDFKDRDELPAELYDLDILDGSPPCSSFSMAGNREKDWGKKKKFREGQAKQVLDMLFFDFLDLAERLQPKVIVAENVKGILLGKAIEYSKKIILKYDEIGYKVKAFTLDASRMGVPQRRERVFFIGIRKDLSLLLPQDQSILFNDFPLLDLFFNEPSISYGDFSDNTDLSVKDNTASSDLWDKVKMGDSFSKAHPKGFFFGNRKEHLDEPLKTIIAESNHGGWHPFIKRMLNKKELLCGGSYATDYDFLGMKTKYLIGMSVPPVMMAQVADRLYNQWLKFLNVKVV